MKDIDSLSLIPELEEMLDNIERVKSRKYGMILRTVFNFHNVTQGPITLLQRMGMPQDDLNKIAQIREAAISDALLTMFQLWYSIENEAEVKAASETMPADLMMLLHKQDEYNG